MYVGSDKNMNLMTRELFRNTFHLRLCKSKTAKIIYKLLYRRRKGRAETLQHRIVARPIYTSAIE